MDKRNINSVSMAISQPVLPQPAMEQPLWINGMGVYYQSTVDLTPFVGVCCLLDFFRQQYTYKIK